MTQDIVIYPGDDTPRIDFTGSSVGASAISLKVLGDSTLSFEGTEGQLFTVTDNLTEGVIFSVNDGGGLPIIEANADGNVSIVRLGENLGVGTDSPEEKLHVVGNALITSGLSALNLSADTISVPVITNLQASATDADDRLDTAETTISQIEDDINTLETSATDHESRIATLESAPGGTSDHGALTGLGDDDHTQYVLATGARSMNTLSVTGNIAVTGTVDGRDIAADGTKLDNHVASGSVHFTEASIDHGSIAGLSDNDHPQYVLATTNTTLSSTVSTHIADSTIHFTEASIDHGSIAGLGDDDHTQYVLATGARSMNSLSVTGNIAVTGTVDGRDVAADGTKLDNHVASGSVHFTEASIDHGSIAGLGDDDHTQYVLATGARSMNSLSVTGNIAVTGTVDGRDIAADGTKLDNHVASSTVHFTEASIDHGSIAGLSDNDHPQYVLATTNTTLSSTVSTHIADSTIHFTEASIDHGSIAGLGDDDHTQYVLATGARSMNSLSVTGNISVTGTVDGRDIAADGTKLDNHVASGSVHFTEASIDHGSIAGLGDDDHTQYVLATGARSMNSLSVTGNISVTGTVDGRDIAADGTAQDSHIADSTIHFTEASIDHGSIAGLGDDDHTQYVLATGARSMNSLSVTGNISVTGTVDGRDIAADGTTQDSHIADSTIHFTEASIDHGSIAGLGDDDHPQYVLSSTNNALSSTVSNLETSATEADKRSQVIWDHLIPHDQNGNWTANTANGGAGYQQNQGGAGAWMYADTSVQGVMTVSNGNTTATNAGATKYHVNFSTYLNIDTVYYFRVATGHSTDVCIRFGVTNDTLAATATPQRGAYAQVDTDVDSNIHFITADDNVRTDADTGLSVTSISQAFRWFAFKVEDAGGGARAVGLYDVDGGGTLLAKNTTNIPDDGSDSAMRAFIQCIGRGSTFRSCYLDTFGVYMPDWLPPNWLH